MQKTRVAIVRGPNLNRWEMQTFLPLQGEFELTGFTSLGHNFPVNEIPFKVRKLFSVGQSLRSSALRSALARRWGDYHDLQGIARAVEGYDIVHSSETVYRCTAQVAKAKRRLGCKLVVTVWENIPYAVHHPAAVRLKQIVNTEADAFLAVSERTREVLLLEGAPEEKIRVVMPGVDVGHFRPMPKDEQLLGRFGCAADDVVVLFVAHLYWEKGIFDLLVAFRRSWDRLGRMPGLKLLIAGKGREQPAVAEWINRLGLTDRAALIGSHPYSAMPAVHNLADIFVLPSIPTRFWQEQFGYVLVESMACGKAVISTRSGSIPEVVGSAGVLVDPGDFLGLRDALERVIAGRQERQELGQAARARAEQVFDLQVAARRIGEVYRRL